MAPVEAEDASSLLLILVLVSSPPTAPSDPPGDAPTDALDAPPPAESSRLGITASTGIDEGLTLGDKVGAVVGAETGVVVGDKVGLRVCTATLTEDDSTSVTESTLVTM